MKPRFIKNSFNSNTDNSMKQFMLPIVLAASVLVSSSLAADERYRVKSSDNLNRIVSRHYVNTGLTKSQLMVAILVRNPRAFKGGNINYLMRGRRLVLPDTENLQVVSAAEAKAILKEHASYYRRGITGNFSLSEYGLNGDSNVSGNSDQQPQYDLSSNDLEQLNSQYLSQQEKLRKVEAEREKLRNQLEKLTEEKKLSDAQLEKLEVKLSQNSETKKNLAAKQGQLNSEAESKQTSSGNDISEGKKKSLLEDQVDKRTQELKESNAFLQKKLQETKSELAENTRENISLERQLGTLKGSKNNSATNESSVATEIGAAKSTTGSLDSSGSIWSKLAWLLPVLALFAGLWFLLRYFLGGRQFGNDEKEGEIYATPAFEMGDSDAFNEDYEEASLETSIKLDVARAYIEADDLTAANEMLQEVIDEGSVEQQQEAIEIMSKLQA